MPQKYTIDPYYETPAWRELRKLTLQRDKHRCRYCGDRAHQADHIIPRRRGGPDAIENLAACCRHCNAMAGNNLFPSFDQKKEWILAHRGLAPRTTIRPKKRRPEQPVKYRKLSGLRRRLALKHQPDHVKEGVILAELQKSQS